MDGLLFDTEPLYIRSLITAAAEHGYEMTEDLYRPMLGCPWHVIHTLLLDLYGPRFPIEDVRAGWLRHFGHLVETELTVKPGVVELLDLINALGLPYAIATSSFRHSVDHHLALHGLAGRFKHIVAHGDYARSKPAPDPYLIAAGKLGVEPADCLALEDSYNGVRSAAAAGMMAVMVPDLLEPTDEIRAVCAAIVPNLHAVREMLAPEPSVT